MPSRLMKMKGKPDKTLSIIPWKVESALPRPKGILTNLKEPKGVMMAFFGMLSWNISAW